MKVIIIIVAILYITGMVTIYVRIRKREKIRRNGMYVGYKVSFPWISIYHMIMKIPLISMYLNYITRCYHVFQPDIKIQNKKKAIKTFLVLVSITGVEIYFIFVKEPTFFHGISAIIITLIFNNEVLYIIMRNLEIKLLNQMIHYFSDVRHYYYQYKSIDYALYDAMNNAGNEMKAHGKKIYEVITSGQVETSVRLYNSTNTFNFLKLFLSLCVQVLETGDEEWEGQSIFQSNLHYLKSEVQVEELKQRKIIYIFSGLIFMTVSPILTLDLCKSFSLSNLPDLTSFYYGFLGISIYVIAILLSILCYFLQVHQRDPLPIQNSSNIFLRKLSEVTWIKKLIHNYTEKNYTKMIRLKKLIKDSNTSISYPQFLIKSAIYFIISLLFLISFFSYTHSIEIEGIKTISLSQEMLTKYSSTQVEQINKDIVMVLDYFIGIKFSMEDMKHEIYDRFDYMKYEGKEELVTLILEAINDIRNEYFKWYELLISMVLAYLAGRIPYLLLIYKKIMLSHNEEQEVIQFQSIVHMLMYMENMSVLTILQTMEIYAIQFKEIIQQCINEFNLGSEQALSKMKEKASYMPFQRMVDNFIVADSIGIVRAFDEIASERIHSMERRKQENEIRIAKKQDNATIIAYIPLCFIIFFYLIIPFMMQSYADYQLITREMY